MNKNNLVKIINKELTILSDLLDGFSNAPDIHPFELDLAISKVKDIYGELLLLKDNKVEVSIDLINANISNERDSKIILESPKPLDKEELKALKVDEVIDKEPPVSVKNESDESKIVAHAEIDFIEETEVVDENVDDISIAKENFVEDDESTKAFSINNTKELEVGEDIIEEVIEKEPEKEIEVIQEEPKIEVVQTIEDKKPQESEPALELVKKSDEGKKEIVADKFRKQNPSINDMLAGIKSRKDLASSIKDKPIKNLKTAIKINDRIWYVNELFSKNSSLYEATISELNNASDLDAALSYLFKNFNWDQNKKSTISFLELIFRRFSEN